MREFVTEMRFLIISNLSVYYLWGMSLPEAAG